MTSHVVPREREGSLLSSREGEIVTLVAQSFKNKEMAENMLISDQTVKSHLRNIFDCELPAGVRKTRPDLSFGLK